MANEIPIALTLNGTKVGAVTSIDIRDDCVIVHGRIDFNMGRMHARFSVTDVSIESEYDHPLLNGKRKTK